MKYFMFSLNYFESIEHAIERIEAMGYIFVQVIKTWSPGGARVELLFKKLSDKK